MLNDSLQRNLKILRCCGAVLNLLQAREFIAKPVYYGSFPHNKQQESFTMSQIYAIDGVIPVIHPSAYVHPSAVVVGDVHIAAGCYVGPCACLRGDFGRLIMEEEANIQDTCVIHSFPQTETVIAAYGHIGHGAVLHGCQIGRNVLVGMNAVLMDGAVVGDESIVAASAFVKAGVIVPPRSLVAGVPAKVIRQVTDEEFAWKLAGTAAYQELVIRSLETLVPVEPLREIEANRPQLRSMEVKPLYQTK